MRLLVAATLSALLGLAAASAAAVPPQTAQKSKQTKRVQVPKLSRKAIRIFLDKIEVAGRIEKPQAIFIIPGRSPEVEDIRIDRTFFREIFRKVEYPTGGWKRGREVVRKEYILW